MRKFPLAIIALSALALFSACNTVEGAGKDIKSAGNAVQNAAE